MMIEQDTANRIKKVISCLNEHQRRIYLAAEAEALGRGGITAISDLTGVHRNTISAGLKGLRSGEEFQDEEVEQQFHLDAFSNTLFLFCGRKRTGSRGCTGKGTVFCCCISGWKAGVSSGRGMEQRRGN